MMNGDQQEQVVKSSITLKFQDENVERQAQILNHCFDDMERFITKVRAKAEQFQRWARVVKTYGEKKASKKGEKPTNIKEQEFITVLQKIKMAFNTLAKLQAIMENPSPEELIHNMFIPLRLIIDASLDGQNRPSLATTVIFPLLSAEACALVYGCVNDEERSLWVALGEAWTMSSDDWRGDCPPFNPKFSDGWQPYGPTTLNHIGMTKNQGRVTMPNSLGAVVYTGPKSSRGTILSNENIIREQRKIVTTKSSWEQEQRTYESQLRDRNAKIYYVINDRATIFEGQELVLRKGDVVEVLDSSTQYWKVRTSQGMIGRAHHTILNTNMNEMIGSSIANGKIEVQSSGVRLTQMPSYEERAASEHFTDEFEDDDVNNMSQSEDHGISESFNFDGVAEVIGVTNTRRTAYEIDAGYSANSYTANNDTVNSYEVVNGNRYSSNYDSNAGNGSSYGVNGSENAYSSNVIMTVSGKVMDGSTTDHISESDVNTSDQAYDQDGLPNDPEANYSMFRPITTQGVPAIVN